MARSECGWGEDWRLCPQPAGGGGGAPSPRLPKSMSPGLPLELSGALQAWAGRAAPDAPEAPSQLLSPCSPSPRLLRHDQTECPGQRLPQRHHPGGADMEDRGELCLGAWGSAGWGGLREGRSLRLLCLPGVQAPGAYPQGCLPLFSDLLLLSSFSSAHCHIHSWGQLPQAPPPAGSLPLPALPAVKGSRAARGSGGGCQDGPSELPPLPRP